MFTKYYTCAAKYLGPEEQLSWPQTGFSIIVNAEGIFIEQLECICFRCSNVYVRDSFCFDFKGVQAPHHMLFWSVRHAWSLVNDHGIGDPCFLDEVILQCLPGRSQAYSLNHSAHKLCRVGLAKADFGGSVNQCKENKWKQVREPERDDLRATSLVP